MPLQFANVVLIHNPIAGRRGRRRRKALQIACEYLAARNICVRIQETSAPGMATELAREASAAGCDLVIVCGGDGTVNEVVNGLAGTSTPMALLPAGTGNILAKELRLPRNVVRAAKCIPEGEVRRIALGRAGGRYFFAVAGVGVDANVVYRLRARMKVSLGQLSYWLETFRQWLAYSYPTFRVVADAWSVESTFAVIGRAANYGGPLKITRGASLLADDFEVVAITARSKLAFPLYLLGVWTGTLPSMPGVRVLRAKRLRGEASFTTRKNPRVCVQCDGELSGTLPQNFSVVPDALSLVFPRRALPRA
jgi:YegS/Rv2252/BmrU family lipid kinase